MPIFTPYTTYTLAQLNDIALNNNLITTDCLKDENKITMEQLIDGEPSEECIYEFLRTGEDEFRLTWQAPKTKLALTKQQFLDQYTAEVTEELEGIYPYVDSPSDVYSFFDKYSSIILGTESIVDYTYYMVEDSYTEASFGMNTTKGYVNVAFDLDVDIPETAEALYDLIVTNNNRAVEIKKEIQPKKYALMVEYERGENKNIIVFDSLQEAVDYMNREFVEADIDEEDSPNYTLEYVQSKMQDSSFCDTFPYFDFYLQEI